MARRSKSGAPIAASSLAIPCVMAGWVRWMSSAAALMRRDPAFAIRAWVVVGLLGYVALPWYAIQDAGWWMAVPRVFGGPETANGAVQALVHRRTWLLLGLAGLGVAGPVGLEVGRRRDRAAAAQRLQR